MEVPQWAQTSLLMSNNEKTNDAGGGENDNEMDFWCQACQTSRMTRKLTMRMIREGLGHALAVSDTRNGTARNEMEMNMKRNEGIPQLPTLGTFTRVWGGESSLTRTTSPPLLVPCCMLNNSCESASCTPVVVWTPHTHMFMKPGIS